MTSTAPDFWQQLQPLFEELLELDGPARAARLDALAADHPALVAELRSLIEAHERHGDFLGLAGGHTAVAPPVSATPSTGAPLAPRDGTVAGSYTLLRLVGRGGMGEVYLAHDARLQRDVALKLLPADLGADPARKARFLAEARAAAALDHPNVATVYDIGETQGGELFIAMAFYDGETLRDRIARGPLPVGEALAVGVQLAAGLAAAHGRGIVHRDVKPANVLLPRGGVPKLLDFGIAKVAGHERTQAGQALGTIAYMSPEQARGEAVDARTDLWSLGVVLYEMLTGERPFGGTSEAATLHALLYAPLRPLPSTVPGPVRDVVARLLARDPAMRHASAAELLDDLRRCGAADAGADRAADRPATAPATSSAALPEPLTSFVGRTRELERLGTLLARARLVTLTGPGGSGKTRLAVRAAAEMAARFPDGVHFVALAPVSDPALVPATVAQALGLRDTGGLPIAERLADYVRGRRLLLVLDNLEHLRDAAPLVVDLLTAGRDVAILATSRAPLAVQGEHEFPVLPLTLPDLHALPPAERLAECCEAVALFTERAQAVRADFALGPDNAAAVAEICVRLDGLPLAVELAAARVRLLPPRAILARLGQRFDLLRSEARDLPARHRTLREVIGWSYGLLSVEEQLVFRHVAVFAGGFTVSAAEALRDESGGPAGDVLEHLSALVTHNLVRSEEQADGEPRFLMLETIREFGRECLRGAGEEDDVRRAHLAVQLRVAEDAVPYLRGPEQASWLARLEAEHDNLRAALDFALESGRTPEAARLGDALSRFWIGRGFLLEGRERLGRILAAADGRVRPDLRARMHSTLGLLTTNRGDPRAARAHYAQSIALFQEVGDQGGVAAARNHESWAAYLCGEQAEARALAQDALALHAARGDVRGVALAHNNLGWVHLSRGELTDARYHLEEMLRGQRALRDPRGVAYALTNLATATIWLDGPEAALALMDEALASARQAGDPLYVAIVEVWTTALGHESGRSSEGMAEMEQRLEVLRAHGHHWGLGLALRTAADICRDAGAYERAMACYDEGLAIYRGIGDPYSVAQILCRMADARRLRGEQAAARTLLGEAAGLAWRLEARLLLAECLDVLARVAHDGGEHARVARLLGASARLREVSRAVMMPPARDAAERALAAVSAALGPDAAAQAWEAGRALSWEALLHEAVTADPMTPSVEARVHAG